MVFVGGENPPYRNDNLAYSDNQLVSMTIRGMDENESQPYLQKPWRSVAYDKDQEIAVAITPFNEDAYQIATTNNGLAWTEYTIYSFASQIKNIWTKVKWIYELQLFIAVAEPLDPEDLDYDNFAFSPNGMDWEPASIRTNEITIKDFEYIPEMKALMAIGHNPNNTEDFSPYMVTFPDESASNPIIGLMDESNWKIKTFPVMGPLGNIAYSSKLRNILVCRYNAFPSSVTSDMAYSYGLVSYDFNY
jgi:hypothetical protein